MRNVDLKADSRIATSALKAHLHGWRHLRKNSKRLRMARSREYREARENLERLDREATPIEELKK